MGNQQLIDHLCSAVGNDCVFTDKADKITHSYDATQKEFLPDAVVYASSPEQVSEVVKIANKFLVPVIPRGAGSGFTGGTLPVRGGIVLVLSRMDKILDIDQDNLIAVAEPGVITGHLQKEVEKYGLFYPPDPASKDFSTLGGNVAECAGGPRCVKYGVTKDYILGLEVVTPTGDIIHTGGPTIKNVTGYDLTRLFVGSEGTLGIVTKIIIRLLPKPAAKKTMLVQFTSIDGAAEAVSTIIRGKVIPATLEFLDANTIDCIKDSTPIPIDRQCRALLIIEVDGDEDGLEKQTTTIRNLIKNLGVVKTDIADSPAESEKIWDVRRSVSPRVKQINPDKFNEDIVVPRSKVPDMIRALDRIAQRYEIPIVNFGHAGDGNIHVNVMVDLSIEGMQEKVDGALQEIFQQTIAMGGALSGEHGIGTAKQPFLSLQLDEATRRYMVTIKHALDPNNILNPGKIFLESDRPISDWEPAR